MLSVTVPTCEIFLAENRDTNSSLALADPCLPGLDFEMLKILYASSSTTQNRPTFNVLISTLSVPTMGLPHAAGIVLAYDHCHSITSFVTIHEHQIYCQNHSLSGSSSNQKVPLLHHPVLPNRRFHEN